MLTICLAACAHLTITVSEIWRDNGENNGRKAGFFIPPLHSTPPLGGGSRRNIGTPFGSEKLEWCRYQMVKKFRIYVYSFWRDPRTWRTDTAWQQRPRLSIASRGKNDFIFWLIFGLRTNLVLSDSLSERLTQKWNDPLELYSVAPEPGAREGTCPL